MRLTAFCNALRIRLLRLCAELHVKTRCFHVWHAMNGRIKYGNDAFSLLSAE